MHGVDEALRRRLESGVRAMGFELIDVELAGGRQNQTVRVYIDSLRGVTVDDCADVSRQLSAILDVEDPFPGSYLLEVSSPGLDRPLVSPEHYRRYRGETIKVRTHQPVDGRRNFKGRLVEVGDDGIVVEVDNACFNLPFATIERGRLVPKV